MTEQTKSTEGIFEYNEADHAFRYNGRRLLSVTEVLTSVGMIDFSKIPVRMLDAAKSRGSSVHLACYIDDAGMLDMRGLDEFIVGCVKAWRKFKADSGIEIFAAESPIYRPELGLAGIVDRQAMLKSGQPAVIEIKTNHVPWWTRFQLAGYEAILGKPHKRFGVAVKPNGTYSANAEFKDPQDRTIFLSALTIAKLKMEDE